jgi:hypothetical protein
VAFGLPSARKGRRRLARSATLELEPHLAAALVESPAAGEGIDDVESPSADAIELVLANGVLEPVALVDHLDEQTVLVKLGAELDPAPTMHERVRDQLGD